MTNQGQETVQPSDQEPNREKLPAPVYYVQSDNDSTVLVGLDVQKFGPWISWFDTVKERRMEAEEIINNSPEQFVFKRAQHEGGATYIFTPMNLEIYNSKVKDRLFNGKDFADEESMTTEFLEAKDNEW